MQSLHAAPPLKIQRKNSEARRQPAWSNIIPIGYADDVGHRGAGGRCLSRQKSPS